LLPIIMPLMFMLGFGYQWSTRDNCSRFLHDSALLSMLMRIPFGVANQPPL
jgi:hypothetical protein